MGFERKYAERVCRLLSPLLAVGVALPAGLAGAQAAPGSEVEARAVEIEEITVTARKREEALQDVPIAVTAFTREFLERGEIRDLQDLEGLVPNLVVDRFPFGPGGAALSIRGISFDDIEKTFDPAVGVILDGVYIGTNTGQLLNSFDFAHLEVLRGPQGTLFGRNTPAGIINVRRSRPTGDWGARASVIAGTEGRNDYKAVLNFPVVEDRVAGKASFFWLNSRGFLENATRGGDDGEVDYLSGSFDLLFTPSEEVEVLVKYERVRDRGEVGPVLNASDRSHVLCLGAPLTKFPPQCGDPAAPRFTTTANFDNAQRVDLDAVTLHAQWRLEAFDVTSITGWRGHDESVALDLDAVAVDFISALRDQRYDQVSQELRLAGRSFDRADWVAGVYYWYAEYDLDQPTFFLFEQPFLNGGRPFPPGTFRTQDAGQTTRSIAAFGQVDWELGADLGLTLGGRYTRERKEFHSQFAFHVFGTAMALPRIDESESWSRFTPKVGLDYRIGEVALAYVSYARGFRSGGYNGRAADPDHARMAYDQEIVDTVELGLKTEWLERRLVANLTAFETRYKDKQEEVFLPSSLGGAQTVVLNAGRATIRGLELELTAFPHEGVRLFATGGLLDAEYDRFFADLNGPHPFTRMLTPRDHTDLELRRAPDWSFAVGGQYRLDLEGGSLVFDAQYRKRDEQRVGITLDPFTDVADARGIAPSLGLLDASISFEAPDVGNGLRLTLFWRNLTREEEQAFFVDSPGLRAISGFNQPRSFGVEIRVGL